MKKFLSVIVLLFATQFYAQSIDSIIKKRSENFALNGIKDFLFYETYCVGCSRIIEEKDINCYLQRSNLYVFWKENEKSFFQEIKRCETSKIKINNKIIKFYLKNAVEIQNENIERYKIGKDSIVGNKIYSKIRSVDHGFHTKTYFYVDSNLIEKHIDEFCLKTDKKEPNINYEHNNNLKMVKLAKYCFKEVKRHTVKRKKIKSSRKKSEDYFN